MPTNLNALIRYKQLDICLKYRFVPCSIKKLQEACTEALGEFRGRYELVSERTIRDDLRVMRSNILGFNAPIISKNGLYTYSDKEYSIFKTPITEIDLLKDILKMLLQERNNIGDIEIDKLLKRISIIVGEPIPDKIEKDIERKINTEPEPSNIYFSLDPFPIESSLLEHEEDYVYKSISSTQEIDSLLMWNEILAAL